MRIFKTACILAVAALVALMAYTPQTAMAGQSADAAKRAADYLMAYEKRGGRPLPPWCYIALSYAGRDLSGTMAMAALGSQLDNLGSGETNNYSVLVLGLTGAEVNPLNFKGHDLVAKIQGAQLPGGKFADNIDGSGQGDKGEQLLVNSHIWALLALTAAGTEIPDRERARQWLLDAQHDDGSFNWLLSKKNPDVDSTGMALMALGALGESKESPGVKRAVKYLKKAQDSDGGYSGWGVPNPESCAMVIMGLKAVGIDPESPDWIKGGKNPVSAMLGYQLPDGSFEHSRGAGSSLMATEQALRALTYTQPAGSAARQSGAGEEKSGAREPSEVRFMPGRSQMVIIQSGIKKVAETGAAPFLENGRVYVPLRYLALSLGVPEEGIVWSPTENKVTLQSGGTSVSMFVGDSTITVNGRQSEMDAAPLLVPPGRIFLPARHVAEALGHSVGWDEVSQSVVIKLAAGL